MTLLFVRSMLDNQGWDHRCGYDSDHIATKLAISGRFVADIPDQNKKTIQIYQDSSVCLKMFLDMDLLETGLLACS